MSSTDKMLWETLVVWPMPLFTSLHNVWMRAGRLSCSNTKTARLLAAKEPNAFRAAHQNQINQPLVGLVFHGVLKHVLNLCI